MGSTGARTIGDVLRRTAEAMPSKVALVDAEKSLTYREFDVEVDRLSAGLKSLGVGKGSCVASLFLNEWQNFQVYFAVARVGAVIVPMNTRHNAGEVAYQLNHSGCETLIYSGHFDELVARIQDEDTHVKNWVACHETSASRPSLSLKELVDQDPDSNFDISVQVEPSDPSGIWYTSGTTGSPKGALVDHASAVAAATNTALILRIHEQSRLLALAPTFHRGPMEDLHLAGFLAGASHTMLHRFDPIEALAIMERQAITHAFVVPSMTWAILQLPNRGDFDLSSITAWMSASAPFPESYRDRLESETTLPPDRIFNVYGITECLLNSYLPPEDAREWRGSSGWPAPDAFVCVVDSLGEPLPDKEVGQIAVSSSSMAKTYVSDQEAWEKVTFERDGRTWYLTGDLGWKSPQGCLYIVDRLKDMIISGGENVYSAEVEQVLSAHPSIREVAVVGVPDERWGESVAAMVVTDTDLTVSEIQDFCSGRLAKYKIPRHIVLSASLPRNSFGKIQKQQIRTQLHS